MEAASAYTFECATCGARHGSLTISEAFELPDDVWAIPKAERESRAKFNLDLCRMAGRQFFRCVLHLPFTARDDDFTWGVWVEVDEDTFQAYLALSNRDGANEPPMTGRLANRIPGYEDANEEPVSIQFGSSTDRPQLLMTAGSTTSLALDQRNGLDEGRYHEILTAIEAGRARRQASVEAASSQVKIVIPVEDFGSETVWADVLEPGRYRIDNVPYLAEAIGLEDEVSAKATASDGRLHLFEVFRRSRFWTCRLSVASTQHQGSLPKVKRAIADRALGASARGRIFHASRRAARDSLRYRETPRIRPCRPSAEQSPISTQETQGWNGCRSSRTATPIPSGRTTAG